jgi:DNA-directed RNA polymerase specialized sigma24 family protein
MNNLLLTSKTFMTDLELRDALIRGDEEVTKEFFFTTCRPLFISIIRRVFNHEVDYDECINELYFYLMQNDAHRLRTYKGPGSIYGWLKVVALRFFKKLPRVVIDNVSKEALIDKAATQAPNTTGDHVEAAIDTNTLLLKMSNKRYAYVLQRLIIDDASPATVALELDVTVDNLYNIKRRAIAAISKQIYKDKKIK